MYVPDISRFFGRDICRKIAGITTLKNRKAGPNDPALVKYADMG
jgi:hypothetical protein